MPALSYKSRFVSLVATGEKPHSIRAWRRRHFKKGDALMHYTAMRTKQCRKIRRDTICTAAAEIFIDATKGIVVVNGGSRFYRDGAQTLTQIEELARRDGFADAEEFFAFFNRGFNLVLCGQLIEWDPFANPPSAIRDPQSR
jgi:hypothetical protein